ncbi:MAG: HmuY family protein [Nitrospinota bacterium]
MKYTLYIGIFVLAIFFLWLLLTFTMPQMNVQTPGFEENEAAELLSLSPVNPAEVGTKLTDTIVYTFDSSTLEKWAFFDFSRGSIVSDVSSFKDPKGWDLAFRRAKMASNGGGTNKNGIVEVASLKTTDFDSVTSVPGDAKFIQDTRTSAGADPKNASLDKWYSYNFMDHNLKSYRNVLIIKTAEGNYAKMQIINYYCKKGEEKLAGCYSIKYVYQGNGGKNFVGDVSEPLNQQVKKAE